MSTNKWYRYRLADTQANLDKAANFFILGLPKPEFGTFNDHSVTRTQNQGGIARLGNSTVEFLWTRLDWNQADIIRRLVAAAEVSGGSGNGTLFATVPKGLGNTDLWIDVSGKAPMPEWSEFLEAQSNGRSYANVRWVWNRVTIEAEPSSVK